MCALFPAHLILFLLADTCLCFHKVFLCGSVHLLAEFVWGFFAGADSDRVHVALRGWFVARRELVAQWGVSRRRELTYKYIGARGGGELSAADSVLQTRACGTSNFGAGGRGGEGGALRRQTWWEGVKVTLSGETTQAVMDPLNSHKQLHLFWIPCPPSPRSISHRTARTHRQRVLAPWEMKMDDEHLAKQGCEKLRR